MNAKQKLLLFLYAICAAVVFVILFSFSDIPIIVCIPISLVATILIKFEFTHKPPVISCHSCGYYGSESSATFHNCPICKSTNTVVMD